MENPPAALVTYHLNPIVAIQHSSPPVLDSSAEETPSTVPVSSGDNDGITFNEFLYTNADNVEVRTLGHLFSRHHIRERADKYVSSYLCVPASHYQYKAMRKLLTEVLLKDSEVIQQQIRILQRKKARRSGRVRNVRPRSKTQYQRYCEEIKASIPYEEYVGKIQKMWQVYKKELQETERQEVAVATAATTTRNVIPSLVIDDAYSTDEAEY